MMYTNKLYFCFSRMAPEVILAMDEGQYDGKVGLSFVTAKFGSLLLLFIKEI